LILLVRKKEDSQEVLLRRFISLAALAAMLVLGSSAFAIPIAIAPAAPAPKAPATAPAPYMGRGERQADLQTVEKGK
jgi:hypothetical protein